MITEYCAFLSQDYIVSGGKYTKSNQTVNVNQVKFDRPVCHCNMPCDVFLSKKNEVWFKCALSNASWIEYHHPFFSVDEPCDFLQKYLGDKVQQAKYRKEKLVGK